MLTLFIGGFVQGELFPAFQGDFWIELDIRIKAWAKSLIWCFLAGFSERLIPSVLDSLAKRVVPTGDRAETAVVVTSTQLAPAAPEAGTS